MNEKIPTTCPLEAVNDWLTAHVIEPPDKTPGGILLPDQSKELPTHGIVFNVGDGFRPDSGVVQPLAVKPYQRIAFHKYGGHRIAVDGDVWYAIREMQVFARDYSKLTPEEKEFYFGAETAFLADPHTWARLYSGNNDYGIRVKQIDERWSAFDEPGHITHAGINDDPRWVVSDHLKNYFGAEIGAMRDLVGASR